MATSLAFLLHFLPFFLIFNLASSESFIGVNYGQVADNLPPPAATAKLLQSTAIGKVRLYGTDPAIIQALANTGIGIVIGAANGDIPGLASDPNFAKTWVNTNVVPYYPASNIILVTVGNEVITSNDTGLVNQMLPAIQNVQGALEAASLGGKVKVSTVHSMAVLRDSEPPSAGRFHPEYDTVLQGLLSFNNATGSPFTINPYPYFAYRSDPGRADNLAFCLFQPNAGRVDPNTNLKYMNMFDAQVDAVRSALDSLGFKNVEIVVAETGWPYKGDTSEAGPSLENAKAYNGNLIAHLRSMVGTPLMPGKSVDTYLFALYDEDLKPGAASERAFGLFNPDQSMIYDAGLTKQQQTNSPVPVSAPTTPDLSKSPVTPKPTKTNSSGTWCVPKAGVSDAELQANLDYACGQGIDCVAIQQGGACFEPNTLLNHAAYAMNLLYQTAGRNPLTCDFSQTAMLSTNNPSYKSSKDVIVKVASVELYYKAVHFYLQEHPDVINDMLNVIALRVDHTRVVDIMRKAGHLRLVKPYMVAVQSNNVSAVNEALNEIYVEEEDYDRLRESIDLHDNFDQIGLAQKIEKHELLEMRRVAAYIYKKAGRWKLSIALSKKDNLYKDCMETCSQSGDRELSEDLLIYFIEKGKKECFASCLFVCYDIIRPDVALELAWMNNMIDFAFPYLLQFIREYTSKMDELIKDKIEAQNEEKAKEKEEKNVIAQQNMYAQLLPLALPAPPMPGMGGGYAPSPPPMSGMGGGYAPSPPPPPMGGMGMPPMPPFGMPPMGGGY